ncbi:MAG TPA: hypothetical protein VL361_01535 [Candidatus Limnocylindrales bacterium]|nr:hypothetical protein [Candidatus Limnocylindrales bacterium]
MVSNGAGSGSFGAGTIVTLTADPAPAGQVFSHWVGAGVSNSVAATTFFVMPASSTTVTAVYMPLSPPTIASWNFVGQTNSLSGMGAAGFDQPPRLG